MGTKQPMLHGTLIADFGIFAAGPYASALLADMGATVVKVESVRGDPMRPVDLLFAAVQRGKRGLALDFEHPRAAEVLDRLFRTVDVVHHNLRPGSAEALGFGYHHVRRVSPQIVYCESPAYGTVGPRASWPGFDQLFQGFVGLEHVGGGLDGPIWYTSGFMDISLSLLSASAIVMALVERERSGEGQRVEVSMLGAALTTRSELCVSQVGGKIDRPPLEESGLGTGPLCRIYETSHGWIALSAVSTEQWARLRTRSGIGRLPDIAVAEARGSRDVELILEGTFKTRSALEWEEELCQAGISCGAVVAASREEVLRSGALHRNGVTVHVRHTDWGEMRQIGRLVESSTSNAPTQASPRLGEHTREILLELGFSPDECEELRREGAVHWPERQTNGEGGG